MSKHQELCQAYTVCRGSVKGYVDECRKFIVGLITKMSVYFELPKEALITYPLDEEYDSKNIYGIYANIGFLNDNDTFCHGKVAIAIYEAPGRFPQERHIIDIAVKKQDDAFVVKLGNLEKEFFIHPDKDVEYNAYFDFIYEKIKHRYENMLDNITTNKTDWKYIGFATQEISNK